MKPGSFEQNPSPNLPQPAVAPTVAPIEDQELLDTLSETLCRYGLRMPALVALEAGRPLAFLGGQLLWIAQPALSLFFPDQAVRQLAQVLEEPAALAALMTHLETRESE